MEQALIAAVAAAGGQAPLARAIGIAQPSVWHWLKKSRRCAAEYVLKVEAVTGVSRHRLRPDLYPSATDDHRTHDATSAVDDEPRVILCSVCELRLDDQTRRNCNFRDCPHSESLAA